MHIHVAVIQCRVQSFFTDFIVGYRYLFCTCAVLRYCVDNFVMPNVYQQQNLISYKKGAWKAAQNDYLVALLYIENKL